MVDFFMMPMDQLVDRYINYLVVEKGLARASIESYSSDLAKYLKFLTSHKISKISDADSTVILKYLLYLRDKKIGARSRTRYLVTIRGFYKFLVHEKVLAKDPAKLIDLPKSGLKLPDVLSAEEINSMLKAPDIATSKGLRDAAMLELLYAAGLRVSELIHVKLQDINLEVGFVRTLGKGSKERVVPIGTYAKQRISDYLENSRPLLLKNRISHYLFVAHA